MTVKPGEKGGSLMLEWGFYRGYPNNKPPLEWNYQAAITTVTRSACTTLRKLGEVKEARWHRGSAVQVGNGGRWRLSPP